MTITVSPARNEYTGNAAQTIFNYTFKIFESTDLNVYVTPSGQVANDSTDITTAYTVTGEGLEVGGSITLSTGVSAGDLVTIVSNIPSSRTTDYQNNGDFRPAVVNSDFDRVVSITKKIEDLQNRTLLQEQSQQNQSPLTLPAPEAGKFLKWNNGRDGLINVSLSGTSSEAGTVPIYFDNIGNMTAFNLSLGDKVECNRYLEGGEFIPGLVYIIEVGTGDGLINHQLDNGLMAALVVVNAISVSQAGAVGDGVTNDALAFKACVDNFKYVNASVPRVSYYFDTAVNITVGNIQIEGSGRDCLIEIKDGNTDGFNVTGQTGVLISGFKIKCKTLTGTLGGLSGKAAIHLINSSQCTVKDCFIFSIYNAGIRLFTSNQNTIENNYFGDWFTTATQNDDASNIFVTGSSSFNSILNNQCLGEDCGNGVAISDYTVAGFQPIGNIVSGNVVANKRAYGILLYTTDTGSPNGYDTRHIIANNVITTIFGDYIAGNSGAGIYMQGGNGAICIGNQVSDCNKLTSTFGTLAMAAIAVNITDETESEPIQVVNNHIKTASGPGIWATSSTEKGILVEGNTVRVTKTTAGNDTGIILSACSQSAVRNNTVHHAGPGTAIFVTTSGRDCKDLDVSHNIVKSENTGGDGISFAQVTSGEFYDIVCIGNSVKATDIAVSVRLVNNGIFSGNNLKAANQAFNAGSSVNLKITNNIFTSTLSSGYGFSISSNPSSFVDATNTFNLGTAKIQHSGVGESNIELYTVVGSATVPPVSGTYQIGDRVISRFAAVGTPKAWRCTTAGEPGTFTSEGNL